LLILQQFSWSGDLIRIVSPEPKGAMEDGKLEP
jgi:hypothetical protein